MDRIIVYPGALPQDTDVLNTNKNTMVALGFAAQASVGIGTVVSGLACLPTSPASMIVNIAPGSIISQESVDATAYGSLAADTSDSVVKQGINLTSTPFTLTAPGTSGQSINYLIEAQFSEADGGSTVLPYYNPSSPTTPYSGPNNTGTSQNTVRQQRVALQLKAGTAATTGTQTTPGVDSGWVGLYVITVNYGQSTITSSSIALSPGAPFIDGGSVLAATQVAGKRIAAFTSSGTFTVPSGVTQIKVICTGGGGGGADCNSSFPPSGSNDASGGGGGAGGTAIGSYTVTPGQAISVTVGAGGAAQANGSASSFGSMCSGAGGPGTAFQATGTSAGGIGGAASGGTINIPGGFGGDGQSGTVAFPGNGGSSYWGGGTRAYSAGGGSPLTGGAYGSGGGGAYNGTNNGCVGASGIVVIEY